jgi:HEAT repeat protein
MLPAIKPLIISSGTDFGMTNPFSSPALPKATSIAGRLLLLIGLLLAVVVHGQPARSLSFEGAQWIWLTEPPTLPLNDFRSGSVFFRNSIALPEKDQIESADLIITADNLFTLFINGKPAGQSEVDNSAWMKPKHINVTDLLLPGRNLLAIEAINTIPGPAGLVVKFDVSLKDGRAFTLVSDASWKCSGKEVPDWNLPQFNDSPWVAPRVLGNFGMAPWNKVAAVRQTPGGKDDPAQSQQAMRELKAALRGLEERVPPADYAWPDAVAFVGNDCSLYRPSGGTASSYDSLTVTTFNPHHTRAYPEHDLPSPVKVGRTLFLLQPARPGTTPRPLVEAGNGAIGTPTASFDGSSIFFSMARDNDPFYHIYRVPTAGGPAVQLTRGPFHDIDPAELPNGQIVFTSTRIGYFEEYHNPPARSLFTMRADGGEIRPLTHTFIFDNEPRVMADGRILFIRSDNFFDRGKVETLLHAIHPDGTEGYTEFGLDIGPDYGSRLRAFNCGSPAPMPDGRVAFVTGSTIVIGAPGSAARDQQVVRLEAGDVAALPDNRLLCTLPRKQPFETTVRGKKRVVQDYSYEKIAILDPQSKTPDLVVLFDSPGSPLHSPVAVVARPRPPLLAEKVNRENAFNLKGTGVLFCQNARFTKNTTAGWPHVRAMRVLAGKGLTMRSSHSYIVHAGSEVVELGTVPLAPDGSFAVEVPADTAIAFQAVDAEGRSELNEMSWIFVRPGETRGCVGCHQPRQASPPCQVAPLQAAATAPLRLLGQGNPHRFRGNNAAVTGEMELQFDRYREVASLNRHADAVDALATGAAEVRQLIAQLSQPDPGVRLSSAQRLALCRDAAAASALAVCLNDSSRELRVAAGLALATCGTRESIAPLLGLAEDPDPMAAQAAAIALENLTGHALTFSAYMDPPRRHAQVKAWRDWFADCSWDQIEQELVGRLASPDRDVVRRAAVALGHTGGDRSRVALRKYVDRERQNNPLVEWRKNHGNRGDGARFNSLSPVNPRTLQAATRALGYLRDTGAVSLLSETLRQQRDPETANLFLAEAAVEALGRLETPESWAALLGAFAELKDYPTHTLWYGDHPALMACHAAPVHYLITEALDRAGAPGCESIVPHLIRSVPTDFDRGLFLENDDCETLVGRVIRRAGAEVAVVETCLAILGDPQAATNAAIHQALLAVHGAWGGTPTPRIRAAHILSLVCRDTRFEPRIRALFTRFSNQTNTISRVFDTGIPVVNALPEKNWCAFYLARALGNLGNRQSVTALLAALKTSQAEAASGRPDPTGPGVLFLQNDLTPCWRAATAWALGRIRDERATPVLLGLVKDMENALDTRHAAVRALQTINDPAAQTSLAELAIDYPEVSVRKALLKTALPGRP